MAKIIGDRMNWRFIRKMLMRVFSIPRSNHCTTSGGAYDNYQELATFFEQLPADVKEGHFVVHATNDGEPKRFILELDYLAHPGFRKLLELAEEEFGFEQVGVLTVPCGSIDIQRILEKWK